MGKKFQKRKENFVCENCGKEVSGTGYTNHCSECLFSKHVDNFPGDRENDCGGLMAPVGMEKQNGNLYIVHLCQKCGEQKRNKISKDDNKEEIYSTMKKLEDNLKQ